MTAAQLPESRGSARHRWITDDEWWDVIQDLKKYAAEHPGCTPDEAIAGLKLPDMTGVPADPKARNGTQRRMAAQARDARQHAEYVIRLRDDPLPSRKRIAPGRAEAGDVSRLDGRSRPRPSAAGTLAAMPPGPPALPAGSAR